MAFHQRHQPVERACHAVDRPGGDLGVDRGGVDLGKKKKHLDNTDVDILFKQMGRKAVPQRVRADALLDPGHFSRFLHGAVQLPR